MKYIRKASDFYSSVTFGETVESVSLEFKKAYNKDADRYKEEIRKDFTAMANSVGGTILIGVCEKVNENDRHVATALANVNIEETRTRILAILAEKVYPPIHFETITLAVDSPCSESTKKILAVIVHPYLHGLGCYETKGGAIKVPYRDDIGVKYYNPSEAIKRMYTAERRIWVISHELEAEGKLAIVVSPAYRVNLETKEQLSSRLKLEHPSLTYTGVAPPYAQPQKIETRTPKMELQIKELQDTQILFEKSGSEFTVPYGLVREIWKQANGQIHIAFDCDVIADESGVFLRTF